MTNVIQGEGFTVNESKFDFFFGRVTSNPRNARRSLDNLEGLRKLGIDEASGGKESHDNYYKNLQIVEKMKIQPITKPEFDRIEPSRRVIVHDYPHQFAIVNLGEPLGCYGLSWRSSPIIQPEIELSPDNLTLWIGVDQRLAAIDLQDGHICLALSLHTNLFQILTLESRTIVLTELEVLLFNNSDCSIQCIKSLPEIAADISISGSDLIIRLIDERRLTLNLQNFTLKELILEQLKTN